MARFSASNGRIFIDDNSGAKVFDTDIPMPVRIGQQTFQKDVEFPDYIDGRTTPPSGVTDNVPSTQIWGDTWRVLAVCDSGADTIDQYVGVFDYKGTLSPKGVTNDVVSLYRDYTLGPSTSGLDIWWTQVKIQYLERSNWRRRNDLGDCDSSEPNEFFSLFPEDEWIALSNSMLLEIAGSIQNKLTNPDDPPWLTRSLSVFPSGGNWILRLRHTNNPYENDFATKPAFSGWTRPTIKTQLRIDVRITEGRWLHT